MVPAPSLCGRAGTAWRSRAGRDASSYLRGSRRKAATGREPRRAPNPGRATRRSAERRPPDPAARTTPRACAALSKAQQTRRQPWSADRDPGARRRPSLTPRMRSFAGGGPEGARGARAPAAPTRRPAVPATRCPRLPVRPQPASHPRGEQLLRSESLRAPGLMYRLSVDSLSDRCQSSRATPCCSQVTASRTGAGAQARVARS